MQYIVARYYFDSLFRDSANKTFLDDLKEEPFIDVGLHMYALGNFQPDDYLGYNFLRGTFGKVIKVESSKKYNKDKHEFIDNLVNDKVLGTIEFLIHHDTHLIFIQNSSKIKPDTFKNKFISIYEKHTKFPAAFKMDFVSDEKNIYETIKTWDKVTKAKFKDLRPSNPSCDDTFENIEKLIKETNSSTANLNFKNDYSNDDGPNKGLDVDSLLIKEALALSAHGYGNAKLEGTKEGNMVCVGTKKTVRKVEVNFDNEGALESIVNTIQEVQKYEKK